MHTAWSASRTGKLSASNCECATLVRMPNSRQALTTRSAISPRLAIRILLNMRSNAEQSLTVLHGLTALDEHLRDLAIAL